jgi:hypothetical protein
MILKNPILVKQFLQSPFILLLSVIAFVGVFSSCLKSKDKYPQLPDDNNPQVLGAKADLSGDITPDITTRVFVGDSAGSPYKCPSLNKVDRFSINFVIKYS